MVCRNDGRVVADGDYVAGLAHVVDSRISQRHSVNNTLTN